MDRGNGAEMIGRGFVLGLGGEEEEGLRLRKKERGERRRWVVSVLEEEEVVEVEEDLVVVVVVVVREDDMVDRSLSLSSRQASSLKSVCLLVEQNSKNMGGPYVVYRSNGNTEQVVTM